jgi:ABC-type glycerol-3-phosphate transport system substrate-binding protein
MPWPIRASKRAWIVACLFFGSAWAHSAHADDPWRDHGAPDGSTITIATFFGEFLPGLRFVATDFEARTGIALRVQGIPYASYQLWVRTQFIGQAPPELLLLEATQMHQYGQAGILLPFDELIEQPNPLRTDNQQAWKTHVRQPLIQQARDAYGNLWFLPYTQYGVGFFHNETATAKVGAGAAETWDELIANMRRVKENGGTAMVTAIKPNDAQSVWAAALLLECLSRPLIPQVNIEHPDGWIFDPLDHQTTLNERITIEERIVAFERGLIDPAKAPAFAETTRLMGEFADQWRPDFLQLDGQEVYELFSRGDIAYTMNGTWYFGTLLSDLELLREIAPERVFEYSTFPFPDLTAASTDLPLVGGINQNAGMRACLIAPRQPREAWRENAAILLAHYLTIPEVAHEVFFNSQSWDICALNEVEPRPEATGLLPQNQYAYLPVADLLGYDDQSIGEFWPLWQEYLGKRINEEQFLQRLSQQHRASLERLARSAGPSLDREFIRSHLGRDFL